MKNIKKKQKIHRHKEIIRFLISGLVILILFIIYIFFAAVHDYKWSEEYIATKKDNWSVIALANPQSNPFYIYSLFNPPVTLITMLNKNESKIIQGKIIYVRDLWARREIGTGKVKEETFPYLIDCTTYKSGWNSDYSNIDKNNIDLKTVKWLDESEGSEEHYKAICDKFLTHKTLEPIINSQKELASMYLKAIPTTKGRIAILYDLMAPLGPFDPISTMEEAKNSKEIINLLFGFYSSEFKIGSEVEPGYFATSPLRFAQSFDHDRYFKEYKSKLNALAQMVQNNQHISVVGNWKSSIYRINNDFGDTKRDYYWQINESNPYFTYKIDDEFATNKNEFKDIFKQMEDLGINVVYKCEDKVIFIVTGTSNNAYGFIYNATSAKDINCGLLSDRFNVVKAQEMDSQWRYWIAN